MTKRTYDPKHYDEYGVYEPTEDEIHTECEVIRKRWSEVVKSNRVITKPCPVEFKIFVDGKRRIKKGDHE